MDDFPRLQVHDIKADVIAQADIGVALATVDRIREDAALADILDLHQEFLCLGVEHREHGGGAEI